ncbi:pyruvoyl-dependent arginine decarboxylase [Methanococcus voltae]|uniref:Pyruvoyl-dependent arginine decarboxylase n=2 Tax=Methanococcus voltae TaxID=2188 RepID=A0A8J7S3M3_METVO|nr:arginine decarboxylase, pyruvoyl-dependent [Methanococcus voltae]MBP2172220.1 arginine decarboxylase [Methanococcus voltae]MBP2200823.1 arginine decarboxylase [Methanococcus voltae]MCS3921547.1 arginine decarboxylase [Methanococcus voltae PS]
MMQSSAIHSPFNAPNTISLVAGEGDAEIALNAFDMCLLESGIANVNLIRISSIMPPKAEVIPLPELPMGSLVPTAYGYQMSDVKGETVAASIGVAIPKDKELCGLIMEYECVGGKKEAEDTVREMAKDGFEMRGWEIDEIISIAAEHTVEKVGCAFAAAALWYK